MSVQKLKPRKVHPPLSSLYSRYDEITENHCKYLLHHLYTHNITEWINPLTKKEVQRDSPITFSFLSICYYGEWSEKIVTIKGFNLKYKEHVEKFIHPAYLYDVTQLIKPIKAASPQQNSPPGAAAHKPRSNSPAGSRIISNSPPGASKIVPGRPIILARRTSQSPPGAATNKPKSNSPPGAATNKPKTNSPPGAATNKPHTKSSSSSAKLDISPKSMNTIINSNASLSTNADKLTENDCKKLVKEIRNKKRGKTAEEIKLLKVINPITNREIGIKNPILKSFLLKCYTTFDKNEEIRKSIKKIINIKSLDILSGKYISINKDKTDKRLALEKKKEEQRLAFQKKEEEKRLELEETKKKMKEKIPIIDKYIEGLVDEFNVRCDELINNCDKDGVLNSHRYISNVINSIIIIIYTKYLHLPYYYNELYMNFSSQLDLKVFMYDKTFREYYESKSLVPWEEFKKYFYNNSKVIYQKNDLTKNVDHTNVELDPKTVEQYHLNTLLNRQHVFEFFKYDHYKGNDYKNHMIQYNKLTTSYNARLNFQHYMFPDSLNFAKEIIDEMDINYNITNGLLPEFIHCRTADPFISANIPFADLVDIINDRLEKLPTITGIKNEATINDTHYDAIIENMKSESFGNNETEYGSPDMIRKNILYSLNGQDPLYVEKNMILHKKNIYYNYEYTGTFPLFSWIPLNHENTKSITNIKYCYPMSSKWQPFKIDPTVLRLLEMDYKNHGIQPYSKWLNETIFKVITDEYASVAALQFADRIQAMTSRIINTIGVYKDKTINPEYNNKKIYLYHGTKNRLHSIGRKGKDIEILGFLSTSLNVYIASVYSGIGQNNVGLIYIFEVDDTHTYINLKDLLNQIILLPLSRIRIIMEFNVGGICVILCRVFRTPSIEQNNLLYNKLLYQNKTIDVNKYATYKITTNDNIMPVCAYVIGELWKTNKEVHDNAELEIYKIKRGDLNGKNVNDKWNMTKKELKDEFLYFSLGQEYELYVDRGVPLISGSLEDIKYSIHQHFIKDCYKALGIPCLDYIFIHGKNRSKVTSLGLTFIKNPITTGILSKDYKNNRTNQFKYNINNFLIDCIFKYDSIKHDNKKINIQPEQGDGKIYADKIEGFRDAGAYLNGNINPLFNKDSFKGALVGEHLQYMRDWKHLFVKYKEASDSDLRKHFIWCNKRIKKLINIIGSVYENYLFFINNTLKGYTKNSNFGSRKGILDHSSKEYRELFTLIKNLEETLLERAKFYSKTIQIVGSMDDFIEFIRNILGDGPLGSLVNTHNSKLYKDAIQEELILEDDVADSFSGGILSINDINKQGLQLKEDTEAIVPIDHMKIYELYKNIPISESKDMRKFNDMPKDMKEYYGGGKNKMGKYMNAGKYIDVSNHCHFRFVNELDS
jgi:hypothetical protein